MDVPAKAKAGDRVCVLLGRDWFPCRVESVGRWSDASGNTYPVYTLRFADGAGIRCGNNSLRPARAAQAGA